MGAGAWDQSPSFRMRKCHIRLTAVAALPAAIEVGIDVGFRGLWPVAQRRFALLGRASFLAAADLRDQFVDDVLLIGEP